MERKHHAIIELHNVGKRPNEIARTLKVNRKLIYRTVQRFKKTGSTKKRHGGGHPLIATSPANVKKVREQIRAAIEAFGKRLALVVKARGGYNKIHIKLHQIHLICLFVVE
jgi:transposase